MDYIKLDKQLRTVGKVITIILAVLLVLAWVVSVIGSWFWFGWGVGLVMTLIFLIIGAFVFGMFVSEKAENERNRALDEELQAEIDAITGRKEAKDSE